MYLSFCFTCRRTCTWHNHDSVVYQVAWRWRVLGHFVLLRLFLFLQTIVYACTCNVFSPLFPAFPAEHLLSTGLAQRVLHPSDEHFPVYRSHWHASASEAVWNAMLRKAKHKCLKLRQFRRVRRSLDDDAMKTLVHVFITSRVVLLQCSSCWVAEVHN